MKKVTKIAETANSKVKLKKIRVAAYCRVSTDSDAQLESLEAQKNHYENYITSRDDWEFAGLYYDEGISSDDSLRRIQKIQTLLAQNTEKRETLTKLMTQGIIDPILFNKETNELLSQADSFRDEINALKNAVSGDVTKVTAATALLHFTEKGGILQEFDDDLFNEYVNRIIVRSRNEVRFELKCGLTLRERI